jgi:hypothetical protein
LAKEQNLCHYSEEIRGMFMDNNIAFLSSYDEYTTFTYADTTITFLTGKNLIRYTSVKEWDNGYLVVMCLNKNEKEYEDYIDLLPILENLYINAQSFLEKIKEVRINYV